MRSGGLGRCVGALPRTFTYPYHIRAVASLVIGQVSRVVTAAGHDAGSQVFPASSLRFRSTAEDSSLSRTGRRREGQFTPSWVLVSICPSPAASGPAVFGSLAPRTLCPVLIWGPSFPLSLSRICEPSHS
jgi:hypothetical protein